MTIDTTKKFFDFDPFKIGMQSILDTIDKQKLHGFPPFNIIKNDENKYTIELAVAGLGKSEISVDVTGSTLKVYSNKKFDDDNCDYLFNGISNRNFSRTFQLADNIEVKGASMFNGILKIFLEQMILDHMKVKKVDIVSQE